MSPRILIPAITLMLFSTPWAAGATCPGDQQRQALDFWIGSWRIVTDTGTEIARSNVRAIAGSCAYEEDWLDQDGLEGRSLTFFDPSTGIWRQVWVDSVGRVARSEGALVDGQLRLEGRHVDVDGRTQPSRTTVGPRDGGSVAYRLELRAADGNWDVAFQGSYRSGAAEPPRTTATPTERPTASTTASVPNVGKVEPVSGLEPPPTPSAPLTVQPVTAEVSKRKRDRIEMASPMTLRVPLGEIEKLPDGYAWSNRDTAPYICGGISVGRVGVTRKNKKGRIAMGIALDLVGSGVLHRGRVDVDLLDHTGATVAHDELANIRVGNSLTEQIGSGFVRKTFELLIEEATFDALMSAAERPDLQITVTAQ